jgi:unsaturated pyranuronate lyase
MPFVDTKKLKVVERAPGWFGRFFHSPSMTFAHYEFKGGSSVHEHFHPQEEVWQVIEGEVEVTVDGKSKVTGPGMAAIIPGGVRHSVKALTDGRAIIVDYPLRPDADGRSSPRYSARKASAGSTRAARRAGK